MSSLLAFKATLAGTPIKEAELEYEIGWHFYFVVDVHRQRIFLCNRTGSLF